MEKSLLDMYCKDAEQLKDWKHKLSSIKHQFRQKWQAAGRIKNRFENIYSDWLNGTTTLPLTIIGMYYCEFNSFQIFKRT